MDREGVERAALINYVAPEVMGFDASTNDWVSRYVSGHEDRLVAVGSVHPRHTRDPGGDAERLFDEKKIRILKIHPPHQVFAANAYNDGLEGLAKIYAAAQARAPARHDSHGDVHLPGRPQPLSPIRWPPTTSPSTFRSFR